MRLIESQSYSNQNHRIKLYRRDVSTLSSKNNMQTATLKSSDVTRDAQVVRIRRHPAENRLARPRVVRSAATLRPASKWTVVAAFILAVVLHAGPVVWLEMQREKPAVAAAVPALIHSTEGFETDTGTATTGAAGAKIAAD